MKSRTSAVAAAIASVIWGASAFAQADATTPPTSTSQDMQEQNSASSETTPSQTGSAQTGSATSSADATAGANDQSPANQSMTNESTLGSSVGTPVDQAKVEKFADAYVEVQTIQQKANAELQTATDPSQADQVKTSAQTDMIAAVERSGLQIEEFNEIVASMAADTELRSRVSAEVQKRIGATTGAADGAEAGT